MSFSSGDNYVATLTLGGAGAHATYYHKANDQVPNTSRSICGCIAVYWSQSCLSVFKRYSYPRNLKRCEPILGCSDFRIYFCTEGGLWIVCPFSKKQRKKMRNNAYMAYD